MEWLGYPAVQSYKNLDISELPLKHAWVFANTTLENIGVFSVKDSCFNCPFKVEKHLTPNQLEAWQVDVSQQETWRIKTVDPQVDSINNKNKWGWICEMRPKLQEFGVYHLDIGRCQFKPVVQQTHIYFPLILFCLVFLGFCSTYTFLKFLWDRRQEMKLKQKPQVVPEKNVPSPKTGVQNDTLPTINVFRGILMSLIIFLTTGGGGYHIFSNDYGGVTVAECILFAYIWSIGVKIPIVIDKAISERSKCTVMREIFIRSFFLFLLGTTIESTVEDHHSILRLWCPLQKIGIAYFIVATVYMLTVQKFEMKSKMLICKAIANLVSLMWCWIVAGFLLSILAILISTFVSLNCLGNLNLQDLRADDLNIEDGVTQNCNNYVTEYANKIYVGDPQKMINVNNYIGFSRGLLGVVSAIIYMMIGLKAGVVYNNYKAHSDRWKLWIVWAKLFEIGGVGFAVLSYPLNFNLWPISSILLVSTSAFYLLTITYFSVEIWNLTSYLLSSFGITSLCILCGHMLFSNTLPFMWGIYFNNHLLYLLQNLWIVLLWLMVAVLLRQRNVHFDI